MEFKKNDIIYLGAYQAYSEKWEIDYQDINGLRELNGDMLNYPLDDYKVIICTPPCNFWSKANYRRYDSEYALNTRDLLPKMIERLGSFNKPFIIENVRNDKLFREYGIYEIARKYRLHIFFIGRHTYFTNVFFPYYDLIDLQTKDFKQVKGYGCVSLTHNRQGGKNVEIVIDRFLSVCKNKNYF